jgi:hypothetical protein
MCTLCLKKWEMWLDRRCSLLDWILSINGAVIFPDLSYRVSSAICFKDYKLLNVTKWPSKYYIRGKELRHEERYNRRHEWCIKMTLSFSLGSLMVFFCPESWRYIFLKWIICILSVEPISPFTIFNLNELLLTPYTGQPVKAIVHRVCHYITNNPVIFNNSYSIFQVDIHYIYI